MAKGGEEFVVQDAKSGEDITRLVLIQVIFEQENKAGQNLLPITFLRQLIAFYGGGMQMLVGRYLEVSIDQLVVEQERFRRHVSDFGAATISALEEQARRNLEMFKRGLAMMFGQISSLDRQPDKTDSKSSGTETK